MDDLFWRAWPVISMWLTVQREYAIVKRYQTRLLRSVFREWLDEAAIFPPALVSASSESDLDFNRPVYHRSMFHDAYDSAEDTVSDSPIEEHAVREEQNRAVIPFSIVYLEPIVDWGAIGVPVSIDDDDIISLNGASPGVQGFHYHFLTLVHTSMTFPS